MTYLNGHEVKKGDTVIGFDLAGNPLTGLVTAIGDDDSSGLISVVPIVPSLAVPVLANRCTHVDDLPREPSLDKKTRLKVLESALLEHAIEGNIPQFYGTLAQIKLIAAVP